MPFRIITCDGKTSIVLLQMPKERWILSNSSSLSMPW
ncbi:hypothetical protein V6Z12_A01G168600 [Gossypium hirsutum]